MPLQRRQAVISDAEWERVRPVIRQLYLREDMTLSFILAALKTVYNFQASKAQLEWKLKQWHIVKNMTAQQWRYANAQIVERQNLGKKSRLYLSGVPLKPLAIQKARSRHGHISVLERFNSAPAADSLPGDLPLLILTPPPEYGAQYRLGDLPWFQCQQLLSALTISAPISPHVSDIPSAASSVLRALSCAVTRKRSSLVQAPDSQQVYQALSLVMPAKAIDDHPFRTEGLTQFSSSRILTFEILETIIFLLSNGFCDYLDHELQERDNINDAILDTIRISNTWTWLLSQHCNDLPLSLQAFLHRMFEKAVTASDLITINSLVRAGVDVDLPLRDPPLGESTFEVSRALHWAVITLNLNMVELLVKLGASTKSVDLEMLQVICRRHRTYDDSALAAMSSWILSIYEYQNEDDSIARTLLDFLSWTPHSPHTELILIFLESKLRGPEALAQLLITAVKTRSHYTFEWISKHPSFLNWVNYLGESILGAAASRNEYPLCERLLELGSASEPAENSYHSVFGTPPQCAASNADPRLVGLLLDHGADVNFCQLALEDPGGDTVLAGHLRRVYTSRATHEDIFYGDIGRTALQSALSSGNEKNVIFLLSRGARQIGGEMATAIRTGQDRMIRQLLAHGAPLPVLSLTDHPTPLESAIVLQDHDLALQIIQMMNTQFPARALYVALRMALVTCDWIIFRKLIDMGRAFMLGQSSKPKNFWLGTAMCLAMRLGIDDMASQIMMVFRPQYSAGTSFITTHPLLKMPPEMSMEEYKKDCLKSITTAAFLRWGSFRGDYCLVTSQALSSSPEFVAILIQHGYRFNIDCSDVVKNPRALDILPLLDADGSCIDRRLLARAIQDKKASVVDWYLSSGIGVNTIRWAKSPYSDTPLVAAVLTGDIDLVEKLVGLGADVNETQKGPPYPTPLVAAAAKGFFRVVKRLLELKADPNGSARSCSGPHWTALEAASSRGRLDIVQLLLDSGASTEGPGLGQYVKSRIYAQDNGYYAVDKLLMGYRSWTKADQDLLHNLRLLGKNSQLDYDTNGSSEGSPEHYPDNNSEDNSEHNSEDNSEENSEDGVSSLHVECDPSKIEYSAGVSSINMEEVESDGGYSGHTWSPLEPMIIMAPRNRTESTKSNLEDLPMPDNDGFLLNNNENSRAGMVEMSTSSDASQQLQRLPGIVGFETSESLSEGNLDTLHAFQGQEGSSDDWLQEIRSFSLREALNLIT